MDRWIIIVCRSVSKIQFYVKFLTIVTGEISIPVFKLFNAYVHAKDEILQGC